MGYENKEERQKGKKGKRGKRGKGEKGRREEGKKGQRDEGTKGKRERKRALWEKEKQNGEGAKRQGLERGGGRGRRLHLFVRIGIGFRCFPRVIKGSRPQHILGT